MRSVYAIAEERGPIKIGIARYPDKRLRTMQTGHARELRLIHTRLSEHAAVAA